MPVHIRRAFAIPLAAALTLLVLFVGVMGFAHTAAGRPLLAVMGRMFRGGSCPLGYDKKVTPAQRQLAAARFTATHRGTLPAAARPALGFTLGQTRRAEVVATLAARGVACAQGTSADLVCLRVPSESLPPAPPGTPPRELWFTFGARDQLLSVVALSREADPRAISDAFGAVTAWVGAQAGPATARAGEGSAAFLAAGALRQASAEFRFSNYYALARATNMGKDYLLTEEYRALID